MLNMNDIKTVQLVDVRVNREDNGTFTFSLTYRIDYENGKVEEIVFPRVASPFDAHYFEIHETPWYRINSIATASECILKPFADKKTDIEYYLKRRVIKEADPVEMSMDEIEAALGKRIKIVNKGDKK